MAMQDCHTQRADFNGVTRQLPEQCLRVLSRQARVIARWQAQAAGLNSWQIDNLLRNRRWQCLHYGVYAAFTGEPPQSALLWAGALRAGPSAVLSHQTAAELDGLLGGPSTLIHVTVPHSQRSKPAPGIRIHRSSRSIGMKQYRGLPPQTMTEETLLDLAEAAATFDDVISLIARACQRRLTTPFLLGETLGMRAKVRWRGEISRALGDVAGGVQSALEYRYVRGVERAHGLPRPDRQAQAACHGGQIFRDIHYRQYRVAVELDGTASHPDAQRWQDKHRDNAAAADGIVTLRYSWADVTERPCETAREIATVLARAGWRGTLRRCGPACRA
jgi:hypothetical protein